MDMDTMPNPTERELHSPAFEVIWGAIKGWDIGLPGEAGYAGANGSHVKVILDALGVNLPLKAAVLVECPECEADIGQGCYDVASGGSGDMVDIHPERGDRMYRVLRGEEAAGDGPLYSNDGTLA